MPLEDEALAQAARQFGGRLLGEVTVVGVGFAGQQYVQDVMKVIIPLRVKIVLQQAGLIELVFQHQPDVSAGVDLFANAVSQLFQKIRVVDGMYRVQAQAVETVFQQPHQGVIQEEIPHFTPVEVDTGAPGRVHVFLEETFGVLAEVVAIGAEVVVDHVEDHRQAVFVGAVDQVLELIRRAVGSLGCIG